MPEPRDRLAKPVDVSAIFLHRRSAGVWLDQPSIESPVQQWASEAMGTPTRLGAPRGDGLGSGRLGTPMTATTVRARNFYGSPVVRRQNTPVGSSRRGTSRSGLLPSWHPRTPLRDITAIGRAIERRRAQLRETEGQEIGTPAHEGQRLLDSSVTRSSAQLEHSSLISPIPTVGIKQCAPSAVKIPKLFLNVASNQNTEDSEFLTPQKKLLNSIDTVEKVVKEELQKLKRTPIAKRAEREKRVRILMSMR